MAQQTLTTAGIASQQGVAYGRIEEVRGDVIVLSIPGTDYRLHLVASGAGQAGDRVHGQIHANAKRVDVVPSGGKYVEPVFGRPRRVQGRVIGADPATNSILVDAAVPVYARLMPHQTLAQFAIGQMVSFDVERGATFSPIK